MMDRVTQLKQHFTAIEHTIRMAEANAAREKQSVRLLAVSKTKPATDIETLFALGQKCFGENYVQEAAEKINKLQHDLRSLFDHQFYKKGLHFFLCKKLTQLLEL